MHPRAHNAMAQVRREILGALETVRLELEIDDRRTVRGECFPPIDRDRLADVASGLRVVLWDIERQIA
jgi:hypothetical protein